VEQRSSRIYPHEIWLDQNCAIFKMLVKTRAGQFGFLNFGLIRFFFESQVFGFSICTPPQRRSILVCENTKTESIHFDEKFPSNYIDRPRRCEGFILHTWHGHLSVDLSQLGRI